MWRVLAFVFALFIFIGVLSTISFFSLSSTDRTEDRTRIQKNEDVLPQTLSLVIEYGSSYTVPFVPGDSVLDTMNFAKAQGFNFEGKEFIGLGFFVEEINGKRQNPKKGFYWIYYVNGQKAWVGVTSYKVNPKDVITWKYEKAF